MSPAHVIPFGMTQPDAPSHVPSACHTVLVQSLSQSGRMPQNWMSRLYALSVAWSQRQAVLARQPTKPKRVEQSHDTHADFELMLHMPMLSENSLDTKDWLYRTCLRTPKSCSVKQKHIGADTTYKSVSHTFGGNSTCNSHNPYTRNTRRASAPTKASTNAA